MPFHTSLSTNVIRDGGGTNPALVRKFSDRELRDLVHDRTGGDVVQVLFLYGEDRQQLMGPTRPMHPATSYGVLRVQ